MKKILSVVLLTLPLFLTNCAPKLGGSDYSLADVGANSTGLRGTIAAVRVINIVATDNNQPGAGSVIGGVSGALLGSQIGGGRGRVVSGVLGGLAGGVAGHLAEQALTNQEGFEYTVNLDNGEVKVIAQGAEPRMSVGQRVLVVVNEKGVKGQKARSRVIPDNSSH